MKTKCMVIDNDIASRNHIKNQIKYFNNYEIAYDCDDAIGALQFLQKHKVDLIFLDIQLPKIHGIDFLKLINNKSQVIIITENKEFAIDGYELNVLDYMLKPVSLNRFIKAINKYQNLNSIQNITFGNSLLDHNSIHEILVKDNNKTYRLKPEDILYVEGMREYIKIFSENENIVTKSSLSGFYDQLPKDIFFQSHKSFIVNKTKVNAFTSSCLEIKHKKIPIGRSYKLNSIELLKSV